LARSPCLAPGQVPASRFARPDSLEIGSWSNCLESLAFPVPCDLCRVGGGRRLGLSREL